MTVQRKCLLALVACVLLVAATIVSPTVGGLFIVVAAFSTVALWLQGFTRTPAFVRRARREARAFQGEAPLALHDVTERSFGMQLNRFSVAICYAAGIVPLALGLALLAAAAQHPDQRRDLLVGGIGITLFGLLLTWYAYRMSRIQIRVDSRGIEADQLFGARRIAWDDVVAVAQQTYSLRGAAMTTDHTIYGADRSITVPARLADRDELMAIVIAHARGVGG